MLKKKKKQINWEDIEYLLEEDNEDIFEEDDTDEDIFYESAMEP